jgi:hypothetical protein
MRRAFLAAAIASAVGLVAGSVNATLIVQTGNHPQIDDNVISNACTAPVPGPALTVKGCFNTNHNQLVDFTSNENIAYTGGQASIQAVDGSLSTLTIAVEGRTFTTLILNIDAIDQQTHGRNPQPDLLSKVQFTDGVTTSALFSLDPHGQNFFTLTGGPFSFITFDVFGGPSFNVSLQDVSDVKQVRIGDTAIVPDPRPDPVPDPVPEPATLALLGVGLASLGVLRRRRTVR